MTRHTDRGGMSAQSIQLSCLHSVSHFKKKHPLCNYKLTGQMSSHAATNTYKGLFKGLCLSSFIQTGRHVQDVYRRSLLCSV